MRRWFLALSFMISLPAIARTGGGASGALGSGQMAFGVQGGIVNATQNDMNTLQSRANVRAGAGPISTGQLNTAYEGALDFMYRFTGTMYALNFRGSYFYERADGSGPGGGYTYGVQGYTIFPMLRLYPMENEIMKFYMQVGLGYGSATGIIGEGMANAKFGSGAFGTLLGMGAEFCITGSQCLSFEGDYRYLDFNRNIASSATGTASFAAGSLSQANTGQEVELDNNDVDMKMSGLMFLFGYNIYF